MAGYYDLVLGIIPVAMFGITGSLSMGGVDLAVAIPVASIVAITVIGHAMFVNAPISTAGEPAAPSTSGHSGGVTPPNAD